jgi:hypothetical protein
MQLDNWINTIETAFQATPEKFVFIPNIGPQVTGWATEDYSKIDGAMLEGFGQWGGGSWQQGSPDDWVLSMNRALQLSDAGKILIMQPTLPDAPDTAAGQLEGEFLIGTYLLLQGDHTYLNMVTGANGVNAFYYPEYQINLGPAVTPLASDVSQYLWNGVYRRDFQNGMVLVNPGTTTITVNLPGTYQQVHATGGGVLTDADLNAQGQYVGGTLSYTPVTQVTLVPGSAAILMSTTQPAAPATPTTPTPQPPGPVQNFTAQAGNGQVTLGWSLPSGADGVVIARRTDQAPASPTDGVQVYQGTQTQFIDSGLVNGQTYYYKAFTYSTAGGTTLYSDASVSPGTTATPTAPVTATPSAPATPAPQNQTPPPVTPTPVTPPAPALAPPDQSWLADLFAQWSHPPRRHKKFKARHMARHQAV